ncbi:MAG: two-component regulator propeller domain-containing protein [Acidobacteriota bacterium]
MRGLIGSLSSLVLVLVCWTGAYAQNGRIEFERLSVNEGLSYGSVRNILQDRFGFIWIGTDDGLNRYDGYQITVYRLNPQDSHSITDNIITDSCEDRDGRLWFATARGGLNRYMKETDNFISYQHNPSDANSLIDNQVNAIFADRASLLWLLTPVGVSKFDPAAGRFTSYRPDAGNARALPNREVLTIYQDRSGTIWLGCRDGGLCRYDATTDSFQVYRHNARDPGSLSHDTVMKIGEDSRGQLWIATSGPALNRYDVATDSFQVYRPPVPVFPLPYWESVHDMCVDSTGDIWLAMGGSGLYRFNTQTGLFRHYRPDRADARAISSGDIRSIHQDRAGTLWFGTWMGGLNRYDPDTDSFKVLRPEGNNPTSLSSNRILKIYEDRAGALWFGTWGGGVSRYDANKRKFACYRAELNRPGSLSDSAVNAILVDRDNNLWIGTRSGGLNRFDPRTDSFIVYRHNPKDPHSISTDTISAIYQDSKGRLWIGTALGVNLYDARNNRFIPYRNDPRLPARLRKALPLNYVHDINEDRAGNLLVACRGLHVYNPETDRDIHYNHKQGQPDSLSSSDTYSIFVDRDGTIWVGTYFSGLNRFNARTGSFMHFRHNINDPASLSNDRVMAIHQDANGTLWIGTSSGLNRYDYHTEKFTSYFVKDGLPNDSIDGILEDKEGNLWLSTHKGLCRFNPATGAVRSYDERDGLQSNEFYYPAYYQSRDGEMFFGGSQGFNRFFPEQIKENQYVPPIYITAFKVFDKPLAKANAILPLGNAQPDKVLELSYQQNFFSLEYAAINFTNAERNQYAYRLEGLDRDWIIAGGRRYVSYTNLTPGEYLFRVKGSNNDGRWNEEGTTLKIRINPPPWRRPWAYASYLVLASAAGWGLIHWRGQRLRAQRKLAAIELRAEASELANRAKTVFLASMSHELRTPINAISGFTQIISRDCHIDEKAEKYLITIRQSSEHLLCLINDVLSLSKIDAGKLTLNEQQFDLHLLLEELITIFQSQAEAKKLTFRAELSPALPVQISADKSKLKQVLINLLGNAVKFTRQGSVTLRVYQASEETVFEVEDTGFGIAPAERKNLFEPFAQTESGRQSAEGDGLGLSISRTFVRMMGGDISVESAPGRGSRFRFAITFTVIPARRLPQSASAVPMTDSELAAWLKDQPAVLTRQLRRTIVEGRTRAACEIAESLASNDSRLAAELKQRIKSLQVDELLLLMEEL